MKMSPGSAMELCSTIEEEAAAETPRSVGSILASIEIQTTVASHERPINQINFEPIRRTFPGARRLHRGTVKSFRRDGNITRSRSLSRGWILGLDRLIRSTTFFVHPHRR
jgi:hypothetical protein